MLSEDTSVYLYYVSQLERIVYLKDEGTLSYIYNINRYTSEATIHSSKHTSYFRVLDYINSFLYCTKPSAFSWWFTLSHVLLLEEYIKASRDYLVADSVATYTVTIFMRTILHHGFWSDSVLCTWKHYISVLQRM